MWPAWGRVIGCRPAVTGGRESSIASLNDGKTIATPSCAFGALTATAAGAGPFSSRSKVSHVENGAVSGDAARHSSHDTTRRFARDMGGVSLHPAASAPHKMLRVA